MTDTLSRPLADRITTLADAPSPSRALPIPESARTAAIDALDAGKTHYTTRPGIIPLREWVSSHLRDQYALDTPVDAITITCGAQEAEFVALKTLATDDAALLYTGGDTVKAHLTRYLPLLNTRITDTPADDVSVVYIGDASNGALLSQAVENDWWIIWSTEFFSDDIGVASVDGAAARTVIIGELEDALPGWRIGWMAGSDKADDLRSYKQSMTICSPSISQWAAYGLVSDDHD